MIIMYTKTGCGWSEEARNFLDEMHVPFEERDIWTNPAWRDEVMRGTGQDKSPTLLIDGIWLTDAGIEDIRVALGL